MLVIAVELRTNSSVTLSDELLNVDTQVLVE